MTMRMRIHKIRHLLGPASGKFWIRRKSWPAWLELGSDMVDRKPTKLGQKRVRWADIEQRQTQAKVAQFGFVVGQTNWASSDDIEAAASSALTTTKIIPNRFQSEFHN